MIACSRYARKGPVGTGGFLVSGAFEVVRVLLLEGPGVGTEARWIATWML